MSEKSIADFSVAGGTYPTYEQQTFLGASMSSFTVNAGFGDTSSTLGVQLVEDEYNQSDKSGLGTGQDVYHNGIKDQFMPPPVGSPVFFSFGTKRATVQDAYLKSFDDLYNHNASVENYARDHFVFGGILQTYTQNKSPAGTPLYSVQVVDPREILSNVQLILNNYAGSTYGGLNMLNIFGFLEFNSVQYEALFSSSNASPLEKIKKGNGDYSFRGTDMFYVGGIPTTDTLYQDSVKFEFNTAAVGSLPTKFPITGTGRSRRCPQGIPYYRIVQAINAMSGFDGELPQEYKNAGFGGYINFRGMNYVVDLTGLPPLPQFYFIDYDQINVLDLCLEICEVLNWELFVTLLPVISHPACQTLYNYNNGKMMTDPKAMIAGIIKINAIDKSSPPSLTAIKSYIDRLTVPIENRDVGYELANTVTDKFLVGAQEVNMHYFTSNTDRDKTSQRSGYSQWTLEASFAQQILPYYGMLGNKAVTIPKGFGSYQQILLDSSTLNAHGVGNYYVATEMELRAAAISFERWSEFLMIYNDMYLESIESGDIRDISSINNTINPLSMFGISIPLEISSNYAVTVPRSVWTTDEEGFDQNDLPKSPCNPPYGYPLYYKRATQIGLPQAGLANLASIGTKMFTQLASLRATRGDKEFSGVLNTIWKELDNNMAGKSPAEIEFYNFIKSSLNSGRVDMQLIERMMSQLGPIVAGSQRVAKKNNQNAQRVYNFLKNISDECLGKKFLVKIPQRVNPNYATTITTAGTGSNTEIRKGPFGFVRRSISNNPLAVVTSDDLPPSSGMNNYQLWWQGTDPYYGALKTNYNPVTEQYEFNYIPENQGGYYPFDLLASYNGENYGVNCGLIPLDATNFINENSRISAYVRFDNSEQLSFDGVSKDSFTQQTIKGNYFVPDISYQLENSSRTGDKFDPSSAELQSPKSVAFVKCDVSETLYMPPKSSNKNISVYGSQVAYKTIQSRPRKIFVPEICKELDSFTYMQRNYAPLTNSGPSVTVRTFDIYSVTSTQTTSQPPTSPINNAVTVVLPNFSLDSGNVYALITLPNRIMPTVTSRYRDSLKEKVYPANLKHFLLLDTVRGLDGFNSVSDPENPTDSLNSDPNTIVERNIYSRLSPNGLGSDAEAAIQKTFEGLTFSLPNKISAASPSPVYPDLVALPLRSSQRCYGPWISSYLASDQVGGKLEFIKDENLAPWNYNGFDLMNNVGKMHATFGTSAMLVSERGGFVVPAAPSGVALARALGDAGPLVTNISVDVSQAGIKTTYKMDLYTASFGKMQKQKLDNLSNVSRNRQKQRDERNALIRKGIGKNQTNINYQQLYKNIENAMKFDDQNSDLMTGGLASQAIDTAVISVIPQTFNSFNVSNGSTTSSGSKATSKVLHQQASMMSSDMLGQGMENLTHNAQAFGKQFYNTASSNFSDDKMPASYEDHPNMSVVAKNNIEAIQDMNTDGTETNRFSSWS